MPDIEVPGAKYKLTIMEVPCDLDALCKKHLKIGKKIREKFGHWRIQHAEGDALWPGFRVIAESDKCPTDKEIAALFHEIYALGPPRSLSFSFLEISIPTAPYPGIFCVAGYTLDEKKQAVQYALTQTFVDSILKLSNGWNIQHLAKLKLNSYMETKNYPAEMCVVTTITK